jgi:hypothetical protein
MLVLSILGIILLRQFGSAQKWQFALAITVVPFWYIAAAMRPRWSLRSFWISWTTYFGVHAVLLSLLLGFALGRVNRVPFLWGVPITMIEGLLLFLAVDGLERKLRRSEK